MAAKWIFSVVGEGLQVLENINNTSTLFLKRHLYFYPEGNDTVIISSQSSNITLTIKRSECITPAPGANMEAFLDSLSLLASS